MVSEGDLVAPAETDHDAALMCGLQIYPEGDQVINIGVKKYRQADILWAKTATEPVQKGAKAVGVLAFVFPNLPDPRNVRFVLECEDVAKKKVFAEFTYDEMNSGDFIPPVPGMTGNF